MPGRKINDDDVIIEKASSSSSSLVPSHQQLHLTEHTSELIDELVRLGFDGASAFIARYGAERVTRAINRAKSHPPGKIRNIAGYIRYIVTTPGPIPDPEPPQEQVRRNKYTSGKYGRMVIR